MTEYPSGTAQNAEIPRYLKTNKKSRGITKDFSSFCIYRYNTLNINDMRDGQDAYTWEKRAAMYANNEYIMNSGFNNGGMVSINRLACQNQIVQFRDIDVQLCLIKRILYVSEKFCTRDFGNCSIEIFSTNHQDNKGWGQYSEADMLYQFTPKALYMVEESEIRKWVEWALSKFKKELEEACKDPSKYKHPVLVDIDAGSTAGIKIGAVAFAKNTNVLLYVPWSLIPHKEVPISRVFSKFLSTRE